MFVFRNVAIIESAAGESYLSSLNQGEAMADGFNPYYKWLGIPLNELPANHYRLLGVSLFEADEDVISNAADRQMAHLRSFQRGKHADDCQRLLNEIAAAKKTLLNAQKRANYDVALRSQTAQPAVTIPPAAAAIPQAQPLPPVSASAPPPRAAAPPAPRPAPAPAKPAPASQPAPCAPRTNYRSRGGMNTAITVVVFLVLGLCAVVSVCGITIYFTFFQSTTTPSGPVQLPPPPPVAVTDGNEAANTAAFESALNDARAGVVSGDVNALNAAIRVATRSAKTDETRARLKEERAIYKAIHRFNGDIKVGVKLRVGKPPFTFHEKVYQVFALEDDVIRYSVSGERHERTREELPPWDVLAFAAAANSLSASHLAAGAAGFALLHEQAQTDQSLRSLGVSLHAEASDAPAYEPLAAEIARQSWNGTATMPIPTVEFSEGDVPEPIPGLNTDGNDDGGDAPKPIPGLSNDE